MNRSQRARSWPRAALLTGGLLLPMLASALGIDYRDSFDGPALDSNWWTTGQTGDSTLALVDGRVVLTQGAQFGGASLALKPWIIGDFTATVDYTLLNWPANNQERLVLNAYASDDDQLGLLRLSDTRYDTPYPWFWPPDHSPGEAYLFSSTVLGLPTNDLTGTLRLQRQGDVVTGSFWNGSGWTEAGHRQWAGEADVPRLLGLGLFSTPELTTAGVQVALDNFALITAVPEPQTWALWLAGAALLGARGRRAARRGA